MDLHQHCGDFLDLQPWVLLVEDVVLWVLHNLQGDQGIRGKREEGIGGAVVRDAWLLGQTPPCTGLFI